MGTRLFSKNQLVSRLFLFVSLKPDLFAQRESQSDLWIIAFVYPWFSTFGMHESMC